MIPQNISNVFIGCRNRVFFANPQTYWIQDPPFSDCKSHNTWFCTLNAPCVVNNYLWHAQFLFTAPGIRCGSALDSAGCSALPPGGFIGPPISTPPTQHTTIKQGGPVCICHTPCALSSPAFCECEPQLHSWARHDESARHAHVEERLECSRSLGVRRVGRCGKRNLIDDRPVLRCGQRVKSATVCTSYYSAIEHGLWFGKPGSSASKPKLPGPPKKIPIFIKWWPDGLS